MSGPGDILLIACYELGHQPLSLASPLGFLARSGYRAAALDMAVEELRVEAVLAARFIGIAVPMHTALRLGLRAAARIRAINPGAHLCFYGLYASLNAEYLLNGIADSVIGGEYELPLVELVRALEAGPLRLVSGVQTRDTAAAPFLGKIAFVPPERSALPALDRYARLEERGNQRLAGYVEASRGCIHRCLHCPIPPVYKGRFFVVPSEIVLADVEAQVAAGATHITFGDPDFLNGPGHSLRLVREIHRRYPHLTFDVTTKVEHILERRDLFPELRALGCVFVVSAVESFSDLVLEKLKKGHTRSGIFMALAILRDAGIPMRPSLVAFTPWTTLADYLEMLDCVREHGLIDHIDPIQFAIRLLVPPGSDLLRQRETVAWLGALDPEAFCYRWQHPDLRMDRLHAQVAARVEAAQAGGEDPLETFLAIRDLARAAASRPESAGDVAAFRAAALARRAAYGRPARLTESWFCWAEPTRDQLVPLGF